MNETIIIKDTELQVREYKGKRVVTFKDIDVITRPFTHSVSNENYKKTG